MTTFTPLNVTYNQGVQSFNGNVRTSLGVRKIR